MPSTATTRNRLEKQGTGENNNSWGTKLNTTAFDLIDAALDGMEDYTLSGTKTLSSTNYAADESRMRFQNITGGTGGTVTIPAVEKLYLVRNGSSGDVIFTTGSGDTATIPTGNVEWISCDGTNVYLARTTNFGSALVSSTGTPTTDAHLANKLYVDAAIAAAGLSSIPGLGAAMTNFLTSPTSSNLRAAVSDETGTGSLVFATSPTLVTPILGTPTSGTLTNCTGFPLANLTGAGTGVLTLLGTPSSANLRSAITDETGTGSLVFATSPTLVTPVLGTPASGNLTSCTGLPVSTGISGLGTGIATALAVNSGSAGAVALINGALGTPSSGTLTNCTGFPLANLTGAGTGVLTFLATPSSANLRSAVTDETGTGSLVFATAPTLSNPVVGTQSPGDNSTKAASTAYVEAACAAVAASKTWVTANDSATATATRTITGLSGNQPYYVTVLGSHDGGASTNIDFQVYNGATWSTVLNVSGTIAGADTLYCHLTVVSLEYGAYIHGYYGTGLSTGGTATNEVGAIVYFTGLSEITQMRAVVKSGANWDAGQLRVAYESVS